MRLKNFIVAFLAFILCSFSVSASAAMQKPEEYVHQFYAWYIKADKGDSPAETQAGLYQYVAKATADRIQQDIKRGSLPNDVGYFTKVQDYDPEEWENSINIHPAVSLNNSVTLVPVSLGKKDKTDVIIFLQQQKEHWTIIKAVDALPYP